MSLGFRIDDSSLNQAQKAMDSMENAVGKFSNTTVSSFGIAAIGISAFFATASLGIAKFISEIGQADMNTQLFAHRMWMSTDAAKAYQSSIDVLGVSLQDLYLSPELMQRFQELRKDALSMQMPDSIYNPMMKSIRDITFEFKRLRLEATYAMQWISFYFMKYMEPIFKSSGLSLKSINDLIQKSMPIWTQKVAQVLSWFVRLGVAAWSVRGGLAAIIAIFAGFKLISLGPLGLALAGIVALLLLIDDYNTHKNHGKSVFGWLWDDIDKFKKSIGGDIDGSLKDIWNTFLSILGTIKEIFKTLDDIVKKITGKGSITVALEILQKGLDGVKATFDAIYNVALLIQGVVEKINGMTSGDAEKEKQGDKDIKQGGSGFWDIFKDILKNNPFGGPGLFGIPFFRGDGGPQQTSFPAYAYHTNSNVKSNSDNITTISNTYNMNGVNDAQSAAKTIAFHQKQTLIRFNQGVLL